jgi:BirA family biotin operon repressor/biotin-[acetyl-CoA-carboxylase] ligase
MNDLPTPLRASRVRTLLGGGRFARDLRVLGIVGSTSDLVLDLAQAGAPDGLVLMAEGQTRGRGRRGARWESPPRCGLYLSVLVRPRSLDPGALTTAAAVAAARALVAAGAEAGIKWPNDLVSGGRKVGGILIDAVQAGSGLHAVIGLGVNTRWRDQGPEVHSTLPYGTVLPPEAGPVDREALAATFLRSLEDALGTSESDPGALRAAYRAFDVLRGARVRLETADGLLEGAWVEADPVLGVRALLPGGERLLPAATTRVAAILAAPPGLT